MKERKTVLLVDESREVLDSIGAAFGEAGWDVRVASDGEEVFRQMADADPDAVLLDLYVPKVNGADVCRLVKSHPHWKRTYLVLMASRVSDAEVDMYRKLGADEILKKPFDPAHAVALAVKALAGAAPA